MRTIPHRSQAAVAPSMNYNYVTKHFDHQGMQHHYGLHVPKQCFGTIPATEATVVVYLPSTLGERPRQDLLTGNGWVLCPVINTRVSTPWKLPLPEWLAELLQHVQRCWTGVGDQMGAHGVQSRSRVGVTSCYALCPSLAGSSLASSVSSAKLLVRPWTAAADPQGVGNLGNQRFNPVWGTGSVEAL